MAKHVHRHSFERVCAFCAKKFVTGMRSALYCSERCRTDAATARRDRGAAGAWLRIKITCGVCGAKFLRTKKTGPNRKYCSPSCSVLSIKKDHLRFIRAYPEAMAAYNRRRYKNYGSDTLFKRLQKKYSDLPSICEAIGCIESRVLELAHKPQYKRNGAPRTLARYERHMFWVLCPTHHRLIDKKTETPERLGLH